MTLDWARMLRRQPLLTLIFIVSDELLLLRVYRDDRDALFETLLNLCADVAKLRITVGMVCTFLGLAVALP